MSESRSSEQVLAEFQTDGAAVLKEHLPKDIHLKGKVVEQTTIAVTACCCES